MSILNLVLPPDTNKGVELYSQTENAVLLDVRSEAEHKEEHIPNSVNIPLNRLPKAEETIPDKNTPLFVYCLSGARSRRATAVLEKLGYTNVTNIGGINSYAGVLVH